MTGVTDSEGMIWQSYRYDANGSMTFGQPQYNNVYSYNAESYNPNMDAQYLRARYYSPGTANFISEDSYLGDITDPLTLNRYSYAKGSPLNYVDPSGRSAEEGDIKAFDIFGNSNKKENGNKQWYEISLDTENDKNNNDFFKLDPQISEKTNKETYKEIKLSENMNQAEKESYISNCNTDIIKKGSWQYDALIAIEKAREQLSNMSEGYYSFGGMLGGTFMIWSGGINGGIVIDKKGDVALASGKYFNVGSPDININGGVFFQTMNAPSYKYAEGESVQAGASFPNVLPIKGVNTIGIDINMVEEGHKKYYGITLSGLESAGVMPAEYHAGYTYSELFESERRINIFDLIEKFIWQTK